MIKYEVHVTDGGSQFWYLDGKRHREDGPAVIHTDSSQSWYLDGKLHREDGPAVIYPDGTQAWYLNDKCHREDGPAEIYANGIQYWYLNGKHLTEEEFNQQMNPSSCEGKLIFIDGKTYKLTEVE